MSLDEYKKMIKDKIVLLQEKCSYRQSQHKYETDIQLLQEKNKIVDKSIHKIGEIIVDKEKILKNIDDILTLVSPSKNQKGELWLLFTDLVEVASQIKQ